MMLSVLHTQLSGQLLSYIGNGIYDLYNILTTIQDKCNTYNKKNKPDINISFTISYKNDVKNVIGKGYNTINDLSHNHLNTTSVHLLEQSTTNEEILSQDNNNNHSIEQCNNNTTLYNEEISYEMAYNLLLDLVNNDIELLEEILLIAKVLVREGVLVAPESKLRKNIDKVILHDIHKRTVQNSGYSR